MITSQMEVKKRSMMVVAEKSLIWQTEQSLHGESHHIQTAHQLSKLTSKEVLIPAV